MDDFSVTATAVPGARGILQGLESIMGTHELKEGYKQIPF